MIDDDEPADSGSSEDRAEYAVGYGKPPREYQFKSGNQAARKKKSSNKKKRTISVSDALMNALQRPLKVRRGEKLVQIKVAELLGDRLVQAIARGTTRELIALFGLLKEHAPETLQATAAAFRVEYHPAQGSTVELPSAAYYDEEEPS